MTFSCHIRNAFGKGKPCPSYRAVFLLLFPRMKKKKTASKRHLDMS